MQKTRLIEAIQINEKHAREEAIDEVKEEVLADYEEEEADRSIKQV